MNQTSAIIKQGYRVASGTSEVDPMFNDDGGTIRLQAPEFKKQGLDLDAYFGGPIDESYVGGTLGLDLSPLHVLIKKPEYHLRGVRWTDAFDQPGKPPFVENFFLSKAEILFKDKTYKALLYIPDPATKPGHFHPPTTLETIAQKIPDIHYGDSVTLRYQGSAIALTPTP